MSGATLPVDAGAARDITLRRVVTIALPVVLSNATVPLQGAIDTAIIGNLGAAAPLAAVALGAAIVSLAFTPFNFLQMGVSGLTAQAEGAGDRRRVMNTLVRALIVALLIASLLMAFRGWLIPPALALFEASAEVEAIAGGYVAIRLLGAPAELANYALIGWFTGQEMTRRLFEMQLIVSAVNVCLNLLFVLQLGWGVEGVALGTAIAGYCGLGYGLWRVWQRKAAVAPDWRIDWARVLDRGELVQVMALNRDILIRTILLMASFTWMTRLASVQGDRILAVNGVLIQFFHVSAYGLDGFAMAAETLVGQALGGRSRARLRRAVLVSGIAALALAAGIALVFTAAGPALIRLFTTVEEVRQGAYAYMLWATLLPLVGVLAFQADGVFIGAAEGPAMRNAMIVSAGLFFPLAWWLTHAWGNHGLWAATWLFLLARAATLAVRYPRLEARAGL